MGIEFNIKNYNHFPKMFSVKFVESRCKCSGNLWRLEVKSTLLAEVVFNPLMPGGNKAAGLFKYVWPFCYHQALKG